MPTVGRQGARRPGNLDKAGPPPYTSPVTRIFLLAAVLFAALPQGVVAASDDGGDPPGKAAGRARRLVENLPLEAKAELRRLYRKYAEAVGNRLEQGPSSPPGSSRT
jgi:hypothetical protein